MAKENTEDYYIGFKGKLEKGQEFPGNYMYKFILPTDNKKIAELQQIFDGTRPQFSTKSSKNNKYTSVTVIIYALDADQVIVFYKQAQKIEGIMML